MTAHNIVSTWIHCDSPEQESSYPSATGWGYRNVRAEDYTLPIWHLPAEKKYGFKRLFRHAVREDSWLHRAEGPEFRRRMEAFMGVPERSVKKNILDAATKVCHRMIPRSQGAGNLRAVRSYKADAGGESSRFPFSAEIRPLHSRPFPRGRAEAYGRRDGPWR